MGFSEEAMYWPTRNSNQLLLQKFDKKAISDDKEKHLNIKTYKRYYLKKKKEVENGNNC